MPRSRYIATAIALAAACAVGVAPAQGVVAPSSQVALAGTVQCSNGQNVTGVWVESQSGGSQWANWRAFPGRVADAYYTAPVTFTGTTSWARLHIGCGGTPQNWWSTKLTPFVLMRAVGTFTVNTQCDASQPGRGQTCTFPPAGDMAPQDGRSHNQGFYGWCTWGAYEQWHNAMNYWPVIGGNANQMDDNATAHRWRVIDVPSRRSMYVRESGGGGYGHVAWVRDVRFSGNTVLIDITEMNGGRQVRNAEPGYTDRFGKYDNTTIKWVPGDQHFIQAWN